MENFNIILLTGMTILIILFIIIILNIKKGNKTNDKAFYNLDDDKVYRNEIYKQVSLDFKPYLQQLFQSIDDLNNKVKKANAEISQVQYDAMRDIFQTAEKLSKEIDNYWNSSRFRKDFSYYISLHYASHLLANSLKTEQQNIKNAFVECKRRQQLLSNQINIAQRRQEKSHGEQRYRLSKEIGDMCKHHKNVSNWKNHIGSLNTKYNQRVTNQNIKTAKYRDYIASNFGTRGRNWKNRCHQRAISRGKRTY